MIEDLKQVRDALGALLKDVEYEAKESFHSGEQDWRADFSENDPDGYDAWNNANAALATIDRIIARGVVVPDGYKLVPIVPTDEVIKAGIDEALKYDDYDVEGQIRRMYNAMLSAAPTPAQPEKMDVEALKRDVISYLDTYVGFINFGVNNEKDECVTIIGHAIDHLAANYDFVKKV